MRRDPYLEALEQQVLEDALFRRRRESFRTTMNGVALALLLALATVAYVEYLFPRDARFVPGGLR